MEMKNIFCKTQRYQKLDIFNGVMCKQSYYFICTKLILPTLVPKRGWKIKTVFGSLFLMECRTRYGMPFSLWRLCLSYDLSRYTEEVIMEMKNIFCKTQRYQKLDIFNEVMWQQSYYFICTKLILPTLVPKRGWKIKTAFWEFVSDGM